MSAQRGDPPIHSLAEAVALLASPYHLEDLSTAAGQGVLLVDLPEGGDAVVDDSDLARSLEPLARLPCPSIALAHGSISGVGQAFADAFDVVVRGGAAELERVLRAVDANPQASLALVQLLRHNEQLDIHEALVAESLVYSVLQSGPEFAAWRASRKIKAVAPAREPAVLADREGARLRVRLNRPHRHNAFSAALRDGLVEALQLALCDDSISEIELRGEGPSFCSGGDLDEFGSLPDPATAHVIRSARNPARLLASLADRTTVYVQGACIGAGCELPAFARRVVAAPDAWFALPEVSLGLVPGAGGTVSLPRRIGRQRTALLALTGQRIDRETALDWGLVDALE